MVAIHKTYLNLISLNLLESWSVQSLLDKNVAYNKNYELARIGDFLIKSRDTINIEDGIEYRRVKVKIRNGGVMLRDTEKGENIGTKKQYRAKVGQFIVSKIDARNGSFGIIPSELDGAVVTNDFPLFTVNEKTILSQFLVLITTTKEFIKFAQSCSSGTTNRQRMDIDLFLQQKIPLPSLEEQERIVKAYQTKIKETNELKKEASDLEGEIERYLFKSLGLTKEQIKQQRNLGLQFMNFENLNEWGLDKILNNSNKKSTKHKLTSIEENPNLAICLFRGKSPKYKEGTSSFILNQKCNRWNEIDLTFVKSVEKDWLKSIDLNNLTKEGDILINSTGEGTIGRSSYIKKEFEGLLYDSHLLLLRFDLTKMNPELFVEIFNSDYGQNQMNDIKSAQATKQTELGTSNLARIKFPIPDDIELQNKIVSKIKEFRSQILHNLSNMKSLKKQAEEEFEQEIFGR
jgi:restriction endonuclease S subunit